MRFSMNICNEIEVATIAIDETTILEIKAVIAQHPDLMFDKVCLTIKAKKSGRRCAARSGFNVLVSNSQVALPRKTILDTSKRRFHGKRSTKTTSAAIHTRRGSIQT